MSAGAQAHAVDRHFERAFARFIKSAGWFAQLARGDARVVEPTLLLDGASGLYSTPHFGRPYAVVFSRQFLIGHGRGLAMHIEAVQQWAAHLAQVTLDDSAGAAAFASLVRKTAARAAATKFSGRYGLDTSHLP